MITHKTNNASLLTIIGLISCTLSLSSKGTCDVCNDMKEILDIYDSEFLTSFSLKLNVSLPTTVNSAQGRSRVVVTYSGSSTGKYMHQEKVDLDPVKYDDSKTVGHDGQGNFILNHDKEMSISLEGKDWRVRHDKEALTVSPANQVIGTHALAPLLEVSPIGSDDAANLFYRYILGLGRGYSQLLDKITSVVVDDQGIAIVKASGKLFSPYPGEWTLEIDTKADYLIRKASFNRAGKSTSSFTSECSGYLAGLIPLRTNGTVTISRYLFNVELKSFSCTPGKELDQKVHLRAAFDEPTSAQFTQMDYSSLFPRGTAIMDFSSIDSDGMPFVRKLVR